MTIPVKETELAKIAKEVAAYKEESAQLAREIEKNKAELAKIERDKLEKIAKEEAEKLAAIKSVSFVAAERRNKLEAEQARGLEKVKGIFRFFEQPGGKLDFNIKKYKDEPLQEYNLLDGEIYTIPRYVAEHLNTNCYTSVHKYTQNKQGKPSSKVGQKVRRTGFQSLDFVDVGEYGNRDKDLITVENV